MKRRKGLLIPRIKLKSRSFEWLLDIGEKMRRHGWRVDRCIDTPFWYNGYTLVMRRETTGERQDRKQREQRLQELEQQWQELTSGLKTNQ